MAKRGPPPKPRSLRLLEGNPAKRPLPPADKHPPLPFTRPEWLDREAKLQWNRAVVTLEARKDLRADWRDILTLYCEAWAEYVDACRTIRERYPRRPGEPRTDTRYVTTTALGNRMLEPLISARDRAAARVLVYLKELGLTPSSRMSLIPGGKPEGEGDDFDTWSSNAGRKPTKGAG